VNILGDRWGLKGEALFVSRVNGINGFWSRLCLFKYSLTLLKHHRWLMVDIPLRLEGNVYLIDWADGGREGI
jgi:hypothetical protein